MQHLVKLGQIHFTVGNCSILSSLMNAFCWLKEGLKNYTVINCKFFLFFFTFHFKYFILIYITEHCYGQFILITQINIYFSFSGTYTVLI